MREKNIAMQTKSRIVAPSANTQYSTHAEINSHLPAHQHTSIIAPREQNHVSDGRSCKITSRYTQPSRRPRSCCSVVQIYNVSNDRLICIGENETRNSRCEKKTALLRHAQTLSIQPTLNLPHPKQPSPCTTTHLMMTIPQRTKPRSRRMQLQGTCAPRSTEPSTTPLLQRCTNLQRQKNLQFDK